jgi:hypothetical protein
MIKMKGLLCLLVLHRTPRLHQSLHVNVLSANTFCQAARALPGTAAPTVNKQASYAVAVCKQARYASLHARRASLL